MRLATSLITTLALSLAGTAAAGTKAGITMPDTTQVGDKQLVLNGLGLREATAFKVDVYVAGLYLETRSSDPSKILASNETKRIVMTFKRGVDRKDIVKAWNEGFHNNSPAVVPKIQSDIEKLNGWMPKFRKGDTLTLTYVPGAGVNVHVNGTHKGLIQGEDFARALFAIWLGPKPPSGALKTGMLGK